MKKIEDYAREIPEELRRAIRGLDSDYRAGIFVALYKHGELSFSDLQKKLEIDKAMLNYHIGKLIESALVQHYYKHELGTEKYSFYNITPFGQDFVEILSHFLRPQPYPIALEESSTTTPDVLITFGDIARAQMTAIRPESLKELMRLFCVCARTRNYADNVWCTTEDTNFGSSLDILTQMDHKSPMKNQPVHPSTV
jgi:DNA-binding HxlR family transcriptional regulator